MEGRRAEEISGRNLWRHLLLRQKNLSLSTAKEVSAMSTTIPPIRRIRYFSLAWLTAAGPMTLLHTSFLAAHLCLFWTALLGFTITLIAVHFMVSLRCVIDSPFIHRFILPARARAIPALLQLAGRRIRCSDRRKTSRSRIDSNQRAVREVVAVFRLS